MRSSILVARPRTLLSLVFALDVDASYFVKTDYGFCIPNDKCKEVAKKMKSLGIDLDTISEATSLSVEEIHKL